MSEDHRDGDDHAGPPGPQGPLVGEAAARLGRPTVPDPGPRPTSGPHSNPKLPPDPEESTTPSDPEESTTPPDPLPPGWFARRIARARSRFDGWAPPGWSWRRVVVGLVLGEAAFAILLFLFLAVTNRSLVISFEPVTVDAPVLPSGGLMIPVAGVGATDLNDTWGAPRTSTRNHKGIDIPAAAGTPVLATASGVIVRLDTNAAGGTTLYQRALDSRTIFYYAHLQRYAPGLRVGHLVRQGDTIAYVGDTGNARGTPHLHFGISVVSNPNRVSNGRQFNPYPLLVDNALMEFADGDAGPPEDSDGG